MTPQVTALAAVAARDAGGRMRDYVYIWGRSDAWLLIKTTFGHLPSAV